MDAIARRFGMSASLCISPNGCIRENLRSRPPFTRVFRVRAQNCPKECAQSACWHSESPKGAKKKTFQNTSLLMEHSEPSAHKHNLGAHLGHFGPRLLGTLVHPFFRSPNSTCMTDQPWRRGAEKQR